MCCLPGSWSLHAGYSACSSQQSLSRLLKVASLLMALALLTVTGCSNPLSGLFSRAPEVYIPPGKCAEIRKPTSIPVWTHDKDGKPVKGVYRAYAGSNVGPGVPSSAVK